MQWSTVWKYLPYNYNTKIGTIENIIQRSIFKTNISGNKIRIRFTNKYSPECLIFEKVIAVVSNENGIILDWVSITCQNKQNIRLRPGEEVYSDIADLKSTEGQCIGIFVHIKEKTSVYSAVSTWSIKNCITHYRKYDEEWRKKNNSDIWLKSCEVFRYLNLDVNKPNAVIGISEIAVLTEEHVDTIALFGDSITHMSYYSDELSKKLYQNFPGRVSLENYGICGNRILRDASYVPEREGEGACFGDAAVNRFERDVFGEKIPDCVVVLQGINDILHPYIMDHPEEVANSDDLITGMKRLIAITKSYDVPVYIGTLLPFQTDEALSWYKEAEKIRQRLNDWIRSSSSTEGVIDFDAAVREKDQIEFMKASYHLGDGIHPNAKGGKVMAEAAYNSLEKWIKHKII